MASRPATPSIEIVVIGNEILLGDVLDTNSNWLCRQLSGVGAVVERVTVLCDELDVVAHVLGSLLARQPDLVITSGGLGPTADDLTLEAVARALGRQMQLDPEALGWLAEKFAQLAREGAVRSPELTPSRRKMAYLPVGACPLPNRVGAAPGVVLQDGSTTIICLPGVPSELQDIYRRKVSPLIADRLGTGFFVEWRLRVSSGDESLLAPVLQMIAGRHAQVYFKSRASRFGPDVQFLLTLSARDEREDDLQRLLQAAFDDLVQGLDEIGVQVVSLNR